MIIGMAGSDRGAKGLSSRARSPSRSRLRTGNSRCEIRVSVAVPREMFAAGQDVLACIAVMNASAAAVTCSSVLPKERAPITDWPDCCGCRVRARSSVDAPVKPLHAHCVPTAEACWPPSAA